MFAQHSEALGLIPVQKRKKSREGGREAQMEGGREGD
jgi:hypothetical protein